MLVTPAHHFPTGVVLAPHRRRALLEWAAGGGLVVEDDYDAEHRYDRAPVSALQGLAPDRVVHTGSVSKSLAPGLRLGWLVAPRALQPELAAQADDIEKMLWSVMRSHRERAELARRLAEREGSNRLAAQFRKRGQEYEEDAEIVHKLIQSRNVSTVPDSTGDDAD